MIHWNEKLFKDLKIILDRDNFIAMNIISGSMLPLIKIGAKIIVEPYNDYKKFDIIVFKQQDKLFCHFTWNKSILSNNSIITKSLKNPCQIDHSVAIHDILGIVSNYHLSVFQKTIVIIKNFL